MSFVEVKLDFEFEVVLAIVRLVVISRCSSYVRYRLTHPWERFGITTICFLINKYVSREKSILIEIGIGVDMR